jgi:hypothetical protein
VEIGGDPPGPGTDVVLSLSGTPGSGTIQYSISGSAEFTGSSYSIGVFRVSGLGNYTNVFEFTDVTGGDGRATNVQTMQVESIRGFGLDNGGSNDKLAINMDSNVSVVTGQTVTFSGSGTFNLGAGETFDQLVQGTHIGSFDLPSTLAGTVGIVIAPAP